MNRPLHCQRRAHPGVAGAWMPGLLLASVPGAQPMSRCAD